MQTKKKLMRPKPMFQLWAICYTEDFQSTGHEKFVGAYEHQRDAIASFKQYNDFTQIYDLDSLDTMENVDLCELRVNAVYSDYDIEDINPLIISYDQLHIVDCCMFKRFPRPKTKKESEEDLMKPESFKW
jgi:hypothetical protein